MKICHLRPKTSLYPSSPQQGQDRGDGGADVHVGLLLRLQHDRLLPHHPPRARTHPRHLQHPHLEAPPADLEEQVSSDDIYSVVQKNSCMFEFPAFVPPANLGLPMHSPPALTEHASLNLARFFFARPCIQFSSDPTVPDIFHPKVALESA